jgi:hypothetical protein
MFHGLVVPLDLANGTERPRGERWEVAQQFEGSLGLLDEAGFALSSTGGTEGGKREVRKAL